MSEHSTGFIVVMTHRHAYYSPRFFGPFLTKQAARDWAYRYADIYGDWFLDGIHELTRHVEHVTGSPAAGPLSDGPTVMPLEEVPF